VVEQYTGHAEEQRTECSEWVTESVRNVPVTRRDTLRKDAYALLQALPAILDLECHLDEAAQLEGGQKVQLLLRGYGKGSTIC